MQFQTAFVLFFFFSSRRRHTRSLRDWSSDVCSSDLANAVIGRIRALLGNAALERARLEVNDVIREILTLTRAEVTAHKASVVADLAPHLPPILGDRVQLQQCLLNLILNGLEAMSAVADRTKLLTIRSRLCEGDAVL